MDNVSKACKLIGTPASSSTRSEGPSRPLDRPGFDGDRILLENEVMGMVSKFSPEVLERAVRLVSDQAKEHPSQWAAICSVAVKIRCAPETLRRWFRLSEKDHGRAAGLTTDERELLKQLQRENRELKRANEILKAASLYFAKAEFDRQKK